MPIYYGQVGGNKHDTVQPVYVPKEVKSDWLPLDTNYKDIIRHNLYIEVLDMIKHGERERVVDMSEITERDDKLSKQAIWNFFLARRSDGSISCNNGKIKLTISNTSDEFVSFIVTRYKQNQERILARWRPDTDLARFVALAKSGRKLLAESFTSTVEPVGQGAA